MVIAIDIGKYSIKIIELAKNEDSIEVINLGIINTFNDLKLYNKAKNNLRKCIREINFGS